MTSAASECVSASTSWNSPNLSSEPASSLPAIASRDLDVGAWTMVAMMIYGFSSSCRRSVCM